MTNIEKLMNGKPICITTPTQEAYNQLMKTLENEEYYRRGCGGAKPATYENKFLRLQDQTCIILRPHDKELDYLSLDRVQSLQREHDVKVLTVEDIKKACFSKTGNSNSAGV